MKAKLYTGILTVLLLTGSMVKAQTADMRDFRNNNARIVVNNYYDDYDYYFSSRINRFHRSYTAFNFYAPIFTDSYWYNYQPFSWGISIYGGRGFGMGNSYYRGYDPFYYNSWYTPVFFNVRFGNRWHNDYYSWYGHNNRYNDYRYGHNTYNNYNNYSSTRSSSANYPSRRTSSNGYESSSNNSNNAVRNGDTRRNTSSTVNRGQSANNNRNVRNIEARKVPARQQTGVGSSNNTTTRTSSSSRSGSSASQGRSSSSKGQSRSSSSRSSSSEKSSKRR